MADNTVANLPTKNAAPAEPAKSLAATVQQVISKAVTSPTDAKIDFAQGVNHITGDAHQKSAGPADAMQSLKKEKEEEKEVAKEDEKKSEVKEGEMPQAALDALKKKQDKEESYDKKKDMK